MGNLRSFRYALLAGFTLAVLIHAQGQDQSGFISVDCGIPAGSSYIDKVTGITYISDANLTDIGITRSIAPEFQSTALEQQFYHVRSFPEGVRSCYTLHPEQSKDDKYLIRARFMYGNYDGQNNAPQFDLYLGVNVWDTIKFDDASSIVTTEIIVPSANYIYVCLVKNGAGTPFISSLELRLLKNSTYQTQRLSEALVLYKRLDLGSMTNQSVRYDDDIYDRIWMPKNFPIWKVLSARSLELIDVQKLNDFRPPPAVMYTAVIPENNASQLSFSVGNSTDTTSQYYVYMHFAEVVSLDSNQTREFNIYLNENLFYHSPIAPYYLYSRTIFSTKPIQGGRFEFVLRATEKSNLPPILNAIEIYMVKDHLQLQTQQEDVDAIEDIKSLYGVKRNWQGDPCAPNCWEGLNCSYEDNYPPRIISLNLSSSGLTGEIAPYIADMTFLQYLDLSNNSLSGTVPDFLSRLPFLRVLNLKRNKLTGSLPAELLERFNNGSLSLSMEENPNICMPASCKKKENQFLVPVVASVATFAALLIALAIFYIMKTRKKQSVGKVDSGLKYINDPFASKNRQFTYSDIVRITNNFKKVLGGGGFGTVYYGSLDDNQKVAVKMLSSSSAQGYKEFHAEIKLLMRVHHRNLTTLVGYCFEGTNMGLIYEYMANGTLDQHLSGRNEYILSWEDRLRIAVDAAQGLEYLHNGCKPPIVHRDVKPSNILLNEKLQAKIGDFGLSRIFPIENETSIWTDVAGTPGYLDPMCSLSNSLNEKSDVYSFGVVLLKIITNRPVIARISLQNVHISEWVKSKLSEGDIRTIVDRSLGDNFNMNSAWKAGELALACASHSSSGRPTMTEVVMGLKECFAIETAQNDEGHGQLDSVDLDTEFSPLAR